MTILDEGAVRSKLRLIHLTNNPNRHPTSGTEIFARICRQAQERGWTFELVTPETARGATWVEAIIESGATVHHVVNGGRGDVGKQVADIVNSSSGPTVLHTHLTSYDIPSALAARRRDDTVLFWHFHSFLPKGFKRALRLRTKYLAFRRTVDRFVAQSENIRQSLVDRGVPYERVVMFSSGIDSSMYAPRTHEEHIEERARMGVPESTRLLLHLGWDPHVKGTDRFLAAVKILVDSGTEVVAFINRGGDAALAMAKEMGLEDAVRVGPIVDDTRPLFVAADCMIAPSRGEGMPFSVVEALATGTPVVASELPGHRYLADNMKACLVVEPDPASLAEAIRQKLSLSAEQLAADGQAASEWIAANLNVDNVIGDLFDNYDRALAERNITA